MPISDLGGVVPGSRCGAAGRDDDQAVEAQLAHRGARDGDVAGVRRIELPAEDADPRPSGHRRGW